MALSRAWLLGAALGALMTGAAWAQDATPAIQFTQSGAGLAVKSWIFDPTSQTYTTTLTAPVSISTSSDFHKKVDIVDYSWGGGKKCSPPKPEHFALAQRKTAYALIHTGTSMGLRSGCGDALFKYQDIYYTLVTKQAVGKVDPVKATLIVPFYHGYRVTINFNLNVSIGP